MAKIQKLVLGFPVICNLVAGEFMDNNTGNPLTAVLIEIELGTFLDDHNLRKTFIPAVLDDEKEALNAMEMSLDNIIEWMNMNHLKINPTKT